MKAIVLGGGLMGSAAAFFLARRGVDVTLIEKRKVGTGASIASFGNCRRTARHLTQLPLAHRSRHIWGQAEALLGMDVEFRVSGHLRLVYDEESLTDMQAHVTEAAKWDLDLDVLNGSDVRRRFPGIGPGAIGASYSPQDGSANPRLIAPAFAAAAQKLGAAIVEEASEITAWKQGDTFQVRTAREQFAGDVLLNCAGAWGARLAMSFGDEVPLDAKGPQMGVTEPLPHRVLPVIGIWTRNHGDGAYLRQVERGNIVFGGAAERVDVDLDPGFARADPTRLPNQLKAVARLLPAIANVAVIRTWSGCEGYVRDGLPVIGPSAATAGLYHAFGFCGHGFQLGPGVGDVMAELVASGTTEVPLHDFRVDRFAA